MGTSTQPFQRQKRTASEFSDTPSSESCQNRATSRICRDTRLPTNPDTHRKRRPGFPHVMAATLERKHWSLERRGHDVGSLHLTNATIKQKRRVRRLREVWGRVRDGQRFTMLSEVAPDVVRRSLDERLARKLAATCDCKHVLGRRRALENVCDDLERHAQEMTRAGSRFLHGSSHLGGRMRWQVLQPCPLARPRLIRRWLIRTRLSLRSVAVVQHRTERGRSAALAGRDAEALKGGIDI